MTRHIFAEIAPRLYDNGWTSLLPLAGKRPLVEGWSCYNSEPVAEGDLDAWCRRWPGANVGLALGRGIVAIDVDVLDEQLAGRIEGIARDVLGFSEFKRIGKAPKFAALYAGDVGSSKHHPLEVFGTSGQVAVFGTHPDTRLPYFWPFEDLLSRGPEDLPPVDQSAVDAFIAEALAILPERAGGRIGGNVGDFAELRGARRGKRGQGWVDVLAAQLRGAVPGTLHNTMISVVAALVWRGFPDAAIAAFVEEHLAAPRSGPYAAVWRQVGAAISSARRKWNTRQAPTPWVRHG